MELINALFHSELNGKLNLAAVKELANIHYWGVSVIPVLLGSALAFTVGGHFDFLVFLLLLGRPFGEKLERVKLKYGV